MSDHKGDRLQETLETSLGAASDAVGEAVWTAREIASAAQYVAASLVHATVTAADAAIIWTRYSRTAIRDAGSFVLETVLGAFEGIGDNDPSGDRDAVPDQQ